MTNRELRKLTRADLIEMLILKCRENEQLKEELEQARKQAKQAAGRPNPTAGMSDHQVRALFSAMRLAADQYFENAERQAEESPWAPVEPEEDDSAWLPIPPDEENPQQAE